MNNPFKYVIHLYILRLYIFVTKYQLKKSSNKKFTYILATKVKASIISPQFSLLAEQPVLVATLRVAWPNSHLVVGFKRVVLRCL